MGNSTAEQHYMKIRTARKRTQAVPLKDSPTLEKHKLLLSTGDASSVFKGLFVARLPACVRLHCDVQ
jgi:hypothetical protein